MADATIEDVLKAHTDAWMALPHVVGTGIGEWRGRPCLVVFVSKQTPELKTRIPSSVEGFPVVIEEVGTVRALPSQEGR